MRSFRTLPSPSVPFLMQEWPFGARRLELSQRTSNGTQRLVATALALAWLLAGCTSEPSAVEQFGAMRPVMREGRTEPRADLGTLAARPAMFGIGAMAGLEGEVTIRDSQVWITRVKDGAPITFGPKATSGANATLLTVGQVRHFQEHALREPLADAEIERAIRAAAVSAGLDPTRPFMFTLRGRATSLQLHVVDGTCLHADPSVPGLRIAIHQSTVLEIVGAYAEHQAGVMTHHGTSVHMHALLDWKGQRITAHVDSLALDAGAVLAVPAH
jgi:acetolactate decarboxylase